MEKLKSNIRIKQILILLVIFLLLLATLKNRDQYRKRVIACVEAGGNFSSCQKSEK